MNASDASSAPLDMAGPTRGDRAVAWLLFAALAAFYAATRQRAYWSDGRVLIGMVEAGTLRYHHAAYLPVARGAYELSRPFAGSDAEPALTLLSALSAAGAAALTYTAARWLGRSRAASLAAALLLALAPGVWFYATCVEVHALQLAAAGATTAWCARAFARGTLGQSALPPALGLASVALTHLSGLLWAPAAALAAFRGSGRWARPTGLAAAIAVIAASAFVGLLVTSGGSPGGSFVRGAFTQVARNWSPAIAWSELVFPASFLLVPLALTLRAPGLLAWRTPLLLLGAVAVPYLAAVPGVTALERGGYALGLMPPLAVLCAAGLERLGRWLILVAPALLALQFAVARGSIDEWAHEYEGVEWVEPLTGEIGERGLVLTLTSDEANAVYGHSRITAVSYERCTTEFGADVAGLTAQALSWIEGAHSLGQRVALTATLLADPGAREFCAAIRGRFGEPVAGRRGEYALLPARAPPP